MPTDPERLHATIVDGVAEMVGNGTRESMAYLTVYRWMATEYPRQFNEYMAWLRENELRHAGKCGKVNALTTT